MINSSYRLNGAFHIHFIFHPFPINKLHKKHKLSEIWSTKDIAGRCFVGDMTESDCGEQKFVVCGVSGIFIRKFNGRIQISVFLLKIS